MAWRIDKSTNLKIERYVILLVLVIMMLIELSIRFTQDRLSGDIRHINLIEEISENVVRTDGTSILFLGNSLIGDGINAEIVKTELGKMNDFSVIVGKIVPDGTNLLEWYYIIKNKILPKRVNPDVLVIGYAWNQLADNHAIFPMRLGAHFCEFSDLSELFDFGLTDVNGQSKFLISKLSTIYSNSETIRNRALGFVIPNYRESTQRINELQKKIIKKSSNQELKASYIRLQNFLNILNKNNTRTIIVAMPILEAYEIDPKMRNMIVEYGMQFFDCRQVPDITKDKYVDSMHLDKEGCEIFSRYLAKKIITKNSNLFTTHLAHHNENEEAHTQLKK